jgi:hypothetical protein
MASRSNESHAKRPDSARQQPQPQVRHSDTAERQKKTEHMIAELKRRPRINREHPLNEF